MNNIITEFTETTGYVKSSAEKLHFHSGYELIYVAGGEASFEINGVQRDISAPAALMLNPFEHHKILCSDGNYHRFAVTLNAEYLEQRIHPHIVAMLKCRPDNFSHIIQPDSLSAAKIEKILAAVSDEIKRPGAYYEQFVSNEIYNLLILLYRLNPGVTSSADEQMIFVQQYIDINYANIENIGGLAEKFYVSAAHLSRTFKAFSGYSPVEYLINTRLYQAQQLLANTSMHINEISAAVGFRDVNNFIRRFKLKFKTTPSDFRKAVSG